MNVGKNFSCNNIGKRKTSDFYATPYSITEQFLEIEKIPLEWKVLEASAGSGAMVRVMKNYLTNVSEYTFEKGEDFLIKNTRFDFIMTNPPFSLAYEFIKKAKQIAKCGFAFLLPLSYLHGKKRFDSIYSDSIFPLSHLYVFTRYPMLGNNLREDGKYKTGMMVYAWYVWLKAPVSREPVIRWIDNNKYVLGARII